MASRPPFRTRPFTANRRLVAASSSAARRYNTIHSLLEVDVTKARQIIKSYRERTGHNLSFTAYLISSLAAAIGEFPEFNAFRKGGKVIQLDDLTISVLVERELDGGRVPEPLAIQRAQEKSLEDIQAEIRAARENQGEMGDLSGMSWIRFVPAWLLGLFIRLASANIQMAQRYGKVAVTAVGMFSAPRSWMVPLSSATVLAAVGGIHREPVLVAGQLQEAEMLHLTLSFNHDLIDGAPAARFGRRLNEIITSADLLQPYRV